LNPAARQLGPDTGASPPEAPWRAPDGLLAIDKPAGPTSHDVVQIVRRRLRAPGAGHLGTLDPAATGLLLVAIGAATRCIAVWQGGEKTYEAALRLGVTTDTQDLAGQVLSRADVTCGESGLRDAARAFVGEIDQVPPMVSAVHHRGERLHAIARRGETVERAPRRVTVSAWDWIAIEPPDATFRVRCSSGTYVRTLAHDLGARLGCGAALAHLRRLRIEPFTLERAVTIDELRSLAPGRVWERGGVPLEDALAHLPAVALTPAEAAAIGNGVRPSIAADRVDARSLAAGERGLAMRGPDGRTIALGSARADESARDAIRLIPRIVFPWAVRA
jgi:tRNA pseudouridine55 synthase